MKFVFGQLFWIFLLSNFSKSSANNLSGPLRISTRHFAPYMYQDSNGHFYKGLEFKFLQRMTEMLNMSLHFQNTPNQSDICYDVAMNVTDICIGGIFPNEDILTYALMSVTYVTDDLTWCVQKAEMMPKFLAQTFIMQPAVWFLSIFGYGYSSGMLVYFLMQFDLNYKRRNNCDWHQTIYLITLPACLGQSPNFQPIKGTVRIFYAFILITAFFLFQIIFTRAYDNFLCAQIPLHQISTFDEIMGKDFRLVGSREALNLLARNKMIPIHKIESFNVCDDISECLKYEPNLKDLAIGGSRQNIINSISNYSSQMFCLDRLENIATYPIALFMRKDFALEAKINAIVQQLVESGFFVKWKSEFQVECEHESQHQSLDPVELSISHISASLIFVMGCGSVLSTSVFAAENFVYWKMKRRRDNRHSIWFYLEQFFDGRRHYFRNVPERLQEQNKNLENHFPYLD